MRAAAHPRAVIVRAIASTGSSVSAKQTRSRSQLRSRNAGSSRRRNTITGSPSAGTRPAPGTNCGSGRRLTRRAWLSGAAAVAATAIGPFVWTRRAGAAGKVVIRTIGGAYEEANVKAIFEPFTKATGIEIVKAPATLGKLLAMFESGNIELDVIDAGELGVLSLSQKGALEKINYKGWKLTNPDDMDPAVRRDDMMGDIYFSSVLGYNSQAFPTGKQPRNWAEFWDNKKFAGPRMLADIA